MAKRLRDVCGLPESEPLWRAGRGFVVRDLPWTVEKLRVIPPKCASNQFNESRALTGMVQNAKT